jgi:hypothetical protein
VRVSCTGKEDTLLCPCACTIDSGHHEWQFLGYVLYNSDHVETWKMLFFNNNEQYETAGRLFAADEQPSLYRNELWESAGHSIDFSESFVALIKSAVKH